MCASLNLCGLIEASAHNSDSLVNNIWSDTHEEKIALVADCI